VVQPTVQKERIEVRFIEQELRDSFIDYSMSVIVQRALPDARDGLKPVHRRILYAMREAGLTPGRPHKKSATVVGDVLGRYHPHGDSAVYDTMVRMVQDFSLRYPLIDGQGNFGSLDGDSAAAYRYTEVRLTPLAMELLSDIEKDTVEHHPNFDGRLVEPEVLPTRLPHLLLNGADGIAVGMATKVPPQNLVELLSAADHLVAHPECDVEALLEFVEGPDFPTGGYIWGRQGIRNAYRTGRGLIDMRARLHLEEGRFGKSSLVVTELPYQVNKTRVIEQITRLVRAGRLDAVTDLRDESDRDGVRLVIELKRDSDPRQVVTKLFKKTQLRYTFGVIMLALVDGRPQELDLKQALECFVTHRLEVIGRRATYDLERSEDRAHVVEGLLVALKDIDRAVELIRSSRTPESARNKLQSEFKLTERQADAILAMRLAQLTGLEQRKLRDELKALRDTIDELRLLVEEESSRRALLRGELEELIEKFGDPRRTEILEGAGEFPIPSGRGDEATVVLLSRHGYIKVQAAHSGAGLAGAEAMAAREGDFVRRVFLCRSSDHLLVITRDGQAFVVAISDLPRGTRSSRGRRLRDFVELQGDDEVVAILPVSDFQGDRHVMVITRRGQVKRTPLNEYGNVRSGGIIGSGLAKDDELFAAFLAEPGAELLIATRMGQTIRFRAEEARPMGRSARGVRAIELSKDDEIVAVLTPRRDTELLVATERGFAKRVPFTEFKLQGRAGKGMSVLPDRSNVGPLVGMLEVLAGDRVIWESSAGALLEAEVDKARTRDRRGPCVRVLELKEDDSRIVAVHPVKAAVNGGAATDTEAEMGGTADPRITQVELELADG
jgi:DNA gyrase subunit A